MVKSNEFSMSWRTRWKSHGEEEQVSEGGGQEGGVSPVIDRG